MTEVTQHLGELMGRSDAEAAAVQEAPDPAGAVDAQSAASASSPDMAAQGVTSGVEPSALAQTAAGHPATTDAVTAATHAAASGAIPEQYTFPFQSHEVFALLPQSIGSRAEGLWSLAHQLAGDPSVLSIAVGGLLLGVVAVAAISTARVWRRGEEFAVAGFGERLSPAGTRYTVRQDAPVSAYADKHGVIRRGEKPAAEEAKQGSSARSGSADAQSQLTKKDTWKDRRAAQAKKSEQDNVPEPKQAPPVAVLDTQQPAQSAGPAKKPEKPPIKGKDIKEPEAAPLIAADETKRPKIVKRQLFRRSSTTVNYAGSFHGSYGSFEQTDRLFARDYLKQTNEAFEAAYLRGKGPNLAELKVGDNHRAERLFMMATRASFEDPQSALAALWQAVDEDRSDAVAWLRLAHFYLELGEFDHARRILEPLQAQAERSGLDIIAAAAANSLAKVAAQRGDVELARKLFAKAVAHAEKTDNPFMLGVASANSGLLEAARKKFDAAKTHLSRGIKGFEACEERVSAARAKLALGIVHSCLGDDEAAEKAWSEAAETFRIAGFADEAAQTRRWLDGDGVPNTIVL